MFNSKEQNNVENSCLFSGSSWVQTTTRRLNVVKLFFSFNYFSFPQVAIRRSLSTKNRLQSKPSPWWICVAESDIVTYLSPSTLGFPCQYHFIGAPYTYFVYLTSIYLTAGQPPSVKHTHISGVLGQMNELLNWNEHLIWRRIITYFIIFENCKMFFRQFFVAWE
jgi:hypothetical protein